MLLFKKVEEVKMEDVLREVNKVEDFRESVEYEGFKMKLICSIKTNKEEGYNLYQVEGKDHIIYRSTFKKVNEKYIERIKEYDRQTKDDILNRISFLNYTIKEMEEDEDINYDDLVSILRLSKERNILSRSLRKI